MERFIRTDLMSLTVISNPRYMPIKTGAIRALASALSSGPPTPRTIELAQNGFADQSMGLSKSPMPLTSSSSSC